MSEFRFGTGPEFTLADILKGSEMLREMNVPRFDGGHYPMIVSPYEFEHWRMTQLLADESISYRVRLTAREVFFSYWRRHRFIAASSALDRALRSEPK